MRNVVLLSMLLLISKGWGQEKRKSSYEESYTQTSQGTAGSITQKARDKGELKGTPYINENFVASEIEGELYMMRYNAAENKFELLENDVVSEYPAKLDQTVIKIPSIQKQYVYKNYRDGKNYQYGFLVWLNEPSDLKLYKSEKVLFVKGIVPKTSYDRAYPDEYKRIKDVYYFQKGAETIDRIPSSAKKFANLFPDKEKEILSFIKEQKISMSEEKDLIRLFTFIQK
ncbi:MAG TPA: hypothetical protein VL022_02965 [Moheibacter sp.]|nr:hypothetical protein [Moheibacter sp.]